MITKQHRLQRLHPLDKVEQVVHALHEYIINGNLKPGTDLPPESEMARQLGVSKFSMREALRVAQAQGLVEIAQGRRTKVAEVSVEPAAGIMNLIFRRSENALLELTEARKCLECDIVRVAVARAQPEHLEAMEQTIRDLETHRNNLEYCINKDIEFHNIIVKASNNRVFEIMLAPLTELLKRSRLETLRFSGIQKPIDEHSMILNAFIKKDPDMAVEVMSRHLQTAEDNLKRLQELDLDGTST